LTKSLAFAEERNRIIANNIANANTPFYKAKRAPVAQFQAALSRAIERSRKAPSAPLVLESTRNITDRGASLEVKPVEDRRPGGSILRHDRNNVSLEKEMAALAENTLTYRTLADLLRQQFMLLRLAVRERPD